MLSILANRIEGGKARIEAIGKAAVAWPDSTLHKSLELFQGRGEQVSDGGDSLVCFYSTEGQPLTIQLREEVAKGHALSPIHGGGIVRA